MQGHEDLLALHDFSEDVVQYNIKKRFCEMESIYTQIGAPILIALNPYRQLPIFNKGFAQRVKDHSAQKRGLRQKADAAFVEPPGPHLFTLAEDTMQ